MPSSLENLTTARSTGDSSTLGNLLSTLTPSESQIQTLYETCASNSQLSALELLLAKYPTCAPHKDTIRAAICTGSPPLFRVLVARDPLVVNTPLDKRGTSLSLTLSAHLPIDFVRFLLDLGADPNADTAPLPSAPRYCCRAVQHARCYRLMLSLLCLLTVRRSKTLERSK